MGIPGLLPALSSITKDVHIKEYAHQRAAVDVYCWLHKGAYGCSAELCQNIPTTSFVSYCMKRIYMLKEHNITPIIVFDGGTLPIKKNTEKSRKKSRDEYRARGMAHLREGNVNAARDAFQKAVDITPEMAWKLIKALRKENIQYIVAPYEADAQLAFLSIEDHVDFVITEDSDLVAYGCKKVLFKLDQYGNGREICLANLGATQNPNFLHFTLRMFRQVCILAGCDYLESIPGLGIKKAHGFIKKYKSADKVLAHLRANRSFMSVIPAGYEQDFVKAEMTFLHQRVFDPTNNSLVHLTPLSDEDKEQWDDLSFLGPEMPDSVAIQVAIGNVNPNTKQPYEEQPPENNNQDQKADSNSASIVTTTPTASLLVKSTSNTLPIQKNSIAQYFTPVTNATKKPFLPPRSSVNKEAQQQDNASSSKKRMRDDDVLAPRTPSPPPGSRNGVSTIIVSKYFSSTKKTLVRSLSSELETTKIQNFESPLLSKNRLSLSASSTPKILRAKEAFALLSSNDAWVIQSDSESEEINGSNEVFNEEELIASDDEYIHSDNDM